MIIVFARRLGQYLEWCDREDKAPGVEAIMATPVKRLRERGWQEGDSIVFLPYWEQGNTNHYALAYLNEIGAPIDQFVPESLVTARGRDRRGRHR